MLLYNEDCAEGMKNHIADSSVDMVITSPPYDNLRTYNGFTLDIETIIAQLFRVVKQGGVVVWIVQDGTDKNGSRTGTSFKQALAFKSAGFNIHDVMIWEKDACAFPEKTRYNPIFEYMFVFSKGRPKTTNLIADKRNKWGGTDVHGTFREPNGELRCRSSTWKEVKCKELGVRNNVWQQPCEKNNKTGHPAVFPKQLIIDHIKTWSNERSLIMDIFSGSGTTALACYDIDREFVGFEISKEYYDKSLERYDDYTAQQKIQFVAESN